MRWELIGHEWAVQLLSAHAADKKTHHAYLFTGAQGSGRRTLAIRFSQALNCENSIEDAIPCLACHTCLQIERGLHPDLLVVKAEQRGSQILIDQIREAQHFLSLSPYSAKYRIALFLNFEDANLHAANALLKTLEEPPERAMLLLTAESSELLLPTIVSRCEPFALHPVPHLTIMDGLMKKFQLQESEANLLSQISAGLPGLAIQYIQLPELLNKRKKCIEDLFTLLRSNLVERFDYIKKFEKDKSNAIFALDTWLLIWRDILYYSINPGTSITNIDYAEKIMDTSSVLEKNIARNAIAKIRQTLELIQKNSNLKLSMEILVMELPILS